jgi:hypothetical protein
LVLLFEVSGTPELDHNIASGWIHSVAATSPFFFSSSSNGLPFEHPAHEEFRQPQNVAHFA